jgi:hypothetical protein
MTVAERPYSEIISRHIPHGATTVISAPAFRRIATRYDRLPRNFLASIYLVATTVRGIL